MMFVAWPVSQALARLLTGENSVPVKYSVHLFEAHGQDDADQAGPGRPHVEAGDAEGWPSQAGPR